LLECLGCRPDFATPVFAAAGCAGRTRDEAVLSFNDIEASTG
jgi:hypothetical protein